MKRCPKCNRTFPDDNQKFCTIDGGLLVADQAFDPNATFRASTPLAPPAPTPPPTQPPASPSQLAETKPDFNATIATSQSAPTVVLPKNTGPTGAATIVDQRLPTPPTSAPLPKPSAPLRQDAPSIPIPPPQAKKKSKLPLILGVLLLLLVLGVGAVVAMFFLFIKPRLKEIRSEPPVATRPAGEENTNTSTTKPPLEEPKTEPEFVPPPNTVEFKNSQAGLDSKLAEHYFDFSFYYPQSWKLVPKGKTAEGLTFVRVERSLPPDFTQENFGVGWYDSKGTFEADRESFPRLVEDLSAKLAARLPEYRKVSEGVTKVNSLDAYEFRFVSLSKGTEKGDLQLWGRVIFLPRGEGQTGATLSMLTTSLAPELSGVDDVGVKGDMPVILESFRFGKK